MTINSNEIAPCIVVFDKVFKPGNFVDLLEEECKQDWGYVSWWSSPVGETGKARQRMDYRSSLTCELLPISIPIEEIAVTRVVPLAQSWNKINADIQPAIWAYRNTYNVEVKEDEGFRCLKYGRGAQYKGHVDHHPSNERVFSLVAFLNDGFEGGELTFPIFDVSVQPKAGSVVMFPSNFPYFHYANSVGENNPDDVKYSLVTWFR